MIYQFKLLSFSIGLIITIVRIGIICRSVSLVGEKERKILKEIVKQAKHPVKSRIIAPGK